ncbi:hypothetical protein RFI_13458, partial [Reticulomyxa filosa]
LAADNANVSQQQSSQPQPQSQSQSQSQPQPQSQAQSQQANIDTENMGGLQQNAIPNIADGIDLEVLAHLPADIQEELLIQQQRQLGRAQFTQATREMDVASVLLSFVFFFKDK